MYELKAIHPEAIGRALARAERYRLLNEPQEAESICRDVLHADPSNQEALTMLLLSLTDQFGREPHVTIMHAREVLARLAGEYERAYYDGVIAERWAKAQLRMNALGHVVYDWFADALRLFEQAAALSAHGNEDAILRWNACVRILQRDARLRPRNDEPVDAGFGDEPPRG